MQVIEQTISLLLQSRLADLQTLAEKDANRTGEPIEDTGLDGRNRLLYVFAS